MQPTMIAERREEACEPRSITQKRMERWIRLQQFVYGLPDDYAYAVCVRERQGRFESSALVSVGWMTWFGWGKGADKQHALAVALLDTSEALSANGSRVFLFSLASWVRRRVKFLRIAGEKARKPEASEPETDRLAG